MRRLVIVLSLFLAVSINLAAWYWPNRPKPIHDAWSGEPLKSVSFAPFRWGQSPLKLVFPSAAEIEADLAALSGRVRGIRTYTSREGLEIVPGLAARYGIEITMGAWLGRLPRTNEAEIRSIIDLANRHPDTIKRVIVGNEVLLRRDLSVDELIGYIRRVKAAIKQPVSYADVWEFWLKHPRLLAEVDFVTVHFLPYWEDFPVGVDEAMEHILAVNAKVRAALPGKPILIGEVGWPSAGRSREGAVPGRWEEAQFINSFLGLAKRHDMDYNIVEAFDQPWKAALEGTVGAAWGLLDAERRPKFDLKGPVQENPDWLKWAAISAALGALAYLASLRGRRGIGFGGLLGAALLAQLFAALLVVCLHLGWTHAYDKVRFATAALHLLLQGGLAWLLYVTALDRLEGRAGAVAEPRNLAASLADLKSNWSLMLPLGRATVSAPRLARYLALRRVWLFEWLMLLFAALAIYQTAMLALAGRYRDFPIENFAVAAAGFPAAALIGILFGSGRWRELAFGGAGAMRRVPRLPEAWLAYVMLVLSIILILVEKRTNLEAWAWVATVLMIATPFALAPLLDRREE